MEGHAALGRRWEGMRHWAAVKPSAGIVDTSTESGGERLARFESAQYARLSRKAAYHASAIRTDDRPRE